ncbi:MAG TPA: alkaline phosphatase family protein [Terriglobales bacterium]
MRPLSWLAVLLLLLTLIGCGGGGTSSGSSPVPTPGPTPVPTPPPAPPPTPPPAPPPAPGTTIPTVDHFAIVVLENTSYSDVVGSASMPYLNGLIAQGGLATNYFADAHPSIPNYFILTTGTPVTLDDSFSGVVDTDNVVRQLTAAGKTWKSYAENIPAPGSLSGDRFPYLRRHNPFSFLSDVQKSPTLSTELVPFTQFATDLAAGTLPNYIYIAPNAIDDAHSCPDGTANCPLSTRLGAADQWLSTNIAPLLSNPAFSQSGILVITFDEAEDNDFTNGGGHVATVLVGSHVRPGFQGTATYDHRSLLGLSMTALSTPIPNDAVAGSATQMTEFFQ